MNLRVGKRDIEVSNPDKKIFSRFSKGEYVRYYQKHAKFMLPHVKERALSLYRFPGGADSEGFYQKQTPQHAPPWIKRQDVKKSSGGSTQYAIVREEADIVYFASQVGEFHTGQSRLPHLDVPDRIVFDLDPQDVPIGVVRDVATTLRGLMKSIGLRPFIMTTGGKGFHILSPILPEIKTDAVAGFAHKVAQVLEGDNPKQVTAQMSKSRRDKKVFVDTYRNSRKHTSIAPFSVRAHVRATIAGPFSWSSLSRMRPDSFTLAKPPRTWSGYFSKVPSLVDVLEQLKS